MRFGICVMANVDEIGFFSHAETLGYDSAWAAEAPANAASTKDTSPPRPQL